MVPPDPGKGVEGGSADVAGRWEGGGLESGWARRAPILQEGSTSTHSSRGLDEHPFFKRAR